MSFLVRKRIKVLPGVYVNVSKSGVSTSVKAGPVSVNSRQRRVRVDLPGPFAWVSKRLGGR